jgi:hypothetical protein
MSLPDKDANRIGATSDGQPRVVDVRDSTDFHSYHGS